MKKYNLDKMVGGWFVGDFTPSIVKTKDFEVAVKYYKKNSYENLHHHKVATEITVICKGEVIMNNKKYKEGDIIYIAPGEETDFKAIKDTVTTVVKFPSLTDDKYE